MLQKNEYVDQVVIDKTRKMIKVTKNPNDFITITDGRFDIGPGLYNKVFP